MNNAVARAAGLIAVAALPVLAGISGEDYTDPASFESGFRLALLIAAGLLVAGSGLAAATIRNRLAPAAERPMSCPISAPPLATAPGRDPGRHPGPQPGPQPGMATDG